MPLRTGSAECYLPDETLRLILGTGRLGHLCVSALLDARRHRPTPEPLQPWAATVPSADGAASRQPSAAKDEAMTLRVPPSPCWTVGPARHDARTHSKWLSPFIRPSASTEWRRERGPQGRQLGLDVSASPRLVSEGGLNLALEGARPAPSPTSCEMGGGRSWEVGGREVRVLDWCWGCSCAGWRQGGTNDWRGLPKRAKNFAGH